MGNGKDAFTNLESTLRDSGHGSQAVIITTDSNGRAHAWNAVNHNGDITYIDSQTGQRSNTPLHNGDNGVFAIPLNPDRRPVTPSMPTPTAGSNRPADSRPATTDRRPAAEPGHGGNSGRDPDAMDVDEEAPTPHAGPSNAGPSNAGSSHDGDSGYDYDGDSDDESVRDFDDDSDHDHGDDMDVDDGPSRVSDPEAHNSEQLGLQPDALQQALRRANDVHRVELDDVHQRLNDWAENGSLAGVVRDAVGDERGPDRGDVGPVSFTRQDLSERLPGFGDMSHGEQLAVVSAVGRLSVGFHEQHGVGGSPENVDKPYRPAGAGDAATGTKDSAAKNSSESLGVTAHRITGNKYLDSFKSDVVNNSETIGDHAPDFTGRNYAVMEMTGSDGQVHYVVDSSVPPVKNVSGRHSEKHLIEWMNRVNEGKSENDKYKATGLYTEREPCGKGAGHAKCSDELRKNLKDVPIYYSTTYRTDPEDVKIGKALDAAKQKEVKAAANLTPAQVRAEVERRFAARYGPDAGRTQTMAAALPGMTDDKAREALKKAIDSDYTKVKAEQRTDKVKAMNQEMEDHLTSIERTWKKVGHQLL
jgi:hypothetical protein